MAGQRKKVPELIGGPYAPPRCKAGGTLGCQIRGKRTVAGLTDAPISWPYSYQDQGGGKRVLIVTPELVRAIRTESTSALCHWWGVSRSLVRDWKAALGVPRVTPGALKVLRERIGERLSPKSLAKGGRAAAKVRTRHGRQKIRPDPDEPG